ncbi:NTP transferase domain-containing protein [Coprothermobacter platensis]|uniref:phosphocholine cytidylyltransferase family protein n=1 Tax=Coprothermobacter platensis TaxID=108819 RepID=UPI000378042E|nr:phosphocholine cytidylyltransferase family protein [Coprothermobacter platensis]
MKFVILAAGEGKRLKPLTEDRPKAMVEVLGKPLVQWQIESLQRAGANSHDIAVVGGFGYDVLKQFLLGKDVQILYNPYWSVANNVLTVYHAFQQIDDDIAIINSDVIAQDNVYGLLTPSTEPYAVVDGTVKAAEEEMKVKLENDKIVVFSKFIDPLESAGEYIGFSFIPRRLRSKMLSIIEGMWNRGEVQKWYEDAFNILCQSHPMLPIFCDGLLWTEIDTHEDLERAKHIATELTSSDSLRGLPKDV